VLERGEYACVCELEEAFVSTGGIYGCDQVGSVFGG
jgi:hypothetical protein